LLAVLLDRMLTLARQEAQADGLSISEISALQQQIDQLNAILSQSVESLIAPNAGNSNNQTRLTVPTNTQADSVDTIGTTSRSGLITPATPQENQSNYYQVQQNQADSVTAQVSPEAQQIISRYEATSGADNVQQINKVGVAPEDAGSGSFLVSTALNSVNTQQQAQSPEQAQQYAQQFAEQYQLQAQQPAQQFSNDSFANAQIQTQTQTQIQTQTLTQQQPIGFASDVSVSQTDFSQQSMSQEVIQATTFQDGIQNNFQANQNNQATQIVKSNGVYLQLGAFANALSAESLGDELAKSGFTPEQQEQGGLYKVLVGPFDFVTVQTASEALSSQGYSFFMVR